MARSLERSGFTGVTVDQARRLGAVGFDGSTDPMVALSWLDDTEKTLDEGMQCPDEVRVRIAGFLLRGSARNWWVYERTRKRHTWALFKTAFHTEFCPPAFVEIKRLEFETVTQGSLFSIEGKIMEADLILIDLKGLDVILGIDWLASNYASMDCFRKEVIFRRPGLPVVAFYGERRRAPSGLISAISARCLLQKVCKRYLAHVVAK